LNCEKWIHRYDADAISETEKEIVEPTAFFGKHLRLIPIPGHPKGSMIIVRGDHHKFFIVEITFSGMIQRQ